MTSGQRITLTYNLFVQERIGALAYKYPVASPESYALFKTAKETPDRGDFLAKGTSPTNQPAPALPSFHPIPSHPYPS